MGLVFVLIMYSYQSIQAMEHSNVTYDPGPERKFINYQVPLVTCQGFLGIIFFSQCTSWESYKTGHPYGQYLDYTPLKMFIDMQNEIISWKSNTFLLGPKMEWTQHFQTSMFRKNINSNEMTVLSCFGTWCSCYVNVYATINMELCGKPVCVKHLNGTALVLKSIGNYYAFR